MRKTTLLILVGFGLLLSLGLAASVSSQTQSAPAAPATIKEELLFEVDPALKRQSETAEGSWDAKHVAFKARIRENVWTMVLDGKPGPKWRDVRYPVFSPNGERLAYAAQKLNDRRALTLQPLLWVMVVDGKEQGPEYLEIGAPEFSPDSQHLAYWGKRKAGWGEVVSLVVDGKGGPPYKELGYYTFSPDSKRFAYAVKRDKGDCFVVVDDQPGPKFDLILGGPVFSRDGKHIVYLAEENQTVFEVRNNQKTREIPSLKGVSSVEHLQFSPDKERLAWVASSGKNASFVVVDDQPGPKFDLILGSPIFSPDGKHIAYIAAEDKGKIGFEVTDNQTLHTIPLGPGFNTVVELQFSPDSKRLLYVLWNSDKHFDLMSYYTEPARRRVVVDGQEGKVYNVLNLFPFFGPDGRHVATRIRGLEKGKGDMIAIDGQEGRVYDDIMLNSDHFISNDTIQYIARVGRKYYRVTQSAQ